MVLPAPTDPSRMAQFNEESYRRVITRLQTMVGVLVLDCGTGRQEPAARAAQAAADQLVLISDAHPSTASLVAEAAELLRTVGPRSRSWSTRCRASATPGWTSEGSRAWCRTP